jgi:hypothetical protein
MQPKTELKDKIKFGVNPEKQKENLVKKEYSPSEQWDHLAFSVVINELAPKGFKEVKQGAYRGSVQANIPFLHKNAVVKTQKIAAQLVRGFRDRAKKDLGLRLSTACRLQEDAIKNRDACKFWEISKKKKHQKEYEHFRDQEGLLHIVINQLDQISIK